MKKNLLFIIAIFFIIMCALYITLKNVQAKARNLQKKNNEYETYLNKEIYGIDLASLINKIVDHNEKNKIEKNEKGYYVENNENSIKLEINMVTVKKTYQMEDFYNNDITRFIQNFNQIKFKCIYIDYNSLGKVNKLVFEEIEEKVIEQTKN